MGQARLDALARAAAVLSEHDDPDVRQVADVLADWLTDRDERSLDVVLGVEHTTTSAALADRNQLLAEARRAFHVGATDNDAAERMAVAWSRYAATGWRRDRALDACPPHRVGRIEECFFHCMKARDRVLSARQIRRVLAIFAAGNGQDAPR